MPTPPSTPRTPPCTPTSGTAASGPAGPRDVIRDDLTSIRRLRGFLHVTRLVRGEEELSSLLDEMVAAIGDALGFRQVFVHMYRPAWDDFKTTTVYGDDAVR